MDTPGPLHDDGEGAGVEGLADQVAGCGPQVGARDRRRHPARDLGRFGRRMKIGGQSLQANHARHVGSGIGGVKNFGFHAGARGLQIKRDLAFALGKINRGNGSFKALQAIFCVLKCAGFFSPCGARQHNLGNVRKRAWQGVNHD